MRRDTATLDLFDVPAAPVLAEGSLDYTRELNAVLSNAITGCGKSRYAVAGRMSELTGHDITKSMIDAWTADSKTEWRFPFEFAAAFEAATDSTCLQELLGRKRGSRILVGEETLLAQWGRVQIEKARIAEDEKRLKVRLTKGKR